MLTCCAPTSYTHVGDTEADFDTFENANLAATHPDEMAACLAMAQAHWSNGTNNSVRSGRAD